MPKFEGDILVGLVEFANVLFQDETRELFGKSKEDFKHELVKTLELLIEILVDLKQTETLLNDWKALCSIENLHLTWAHELFENINSR